MSGFWRGFAITIWLFVLAQSAYVNFVDASDGFWVDLFEVLVMGFAGGMFVYESLKFVEEYKKIQEGV